MCGIAGAFVTKKSKKNLDLHNLLPQMVKTLDHRGPDSNGIKIQNNVGLGHTRLSVIDLSEAGNQPMISENENIIIVYNGEVYNFLELKKILIKSGFTFKSNTDTEVILYGYCLWGKEIFSKLQGMFAIGIWDKNNEELILARDHIGKKPLYYSWDGGILLFASEIKGILAHKEHNRECDLEAIHHYLTFQYVPSPFSAFKGIKKIPPASFLSFNKNGEINEYKYWQLPPPQKQKSRPLEEIQIELKEKLEDAIKLRMISDVPVGAFLSGGVDSSSVVALMAKLSSKKIKTFSIGFQESEYDERKYARMVAERYDTDHTEMIVTPKAIDILDKIVWHYNEPFADPSAVATFYVSEIAKREVTVVLNGDGGDEIFLGYPRYEICKKYENIGNINPLIKRTSNKISNYIPPSLEKYKLPRVARRILKNIGSKNSEKYAHSIIYFSDIDKKNCYGEKMREYLEFSSLKIFDKYFDECNSYLAGAAWTDIHNYLPDDLLVKVDIASMAFGLEARSPFLDHRFIEWANKINPKQKMFNAIPKYLLKKTMEPFLPNDLLYRPKMGFGVPIDYWLKNELKELAYDTLLSNKSKSRGIIKPSYIKSLLDDHVNNNRLNHTRIWALLMLELWFINWID